MMKICCKNRYENLRKSLLENSLRRLYYSKKEKVVKPQLFAGICQIRRIIAKRKRWSSRNLKLSKADKQAIIAKRKRWSSRNETLELQHLC